MHERCWRIPFNIRCSLRTEVEDTIWTKLCITRHFSLIITIRNIHYNLQLLRCPVDREIGKELRIIRAIICNRECFCLSVSS